MVRVGRLNLKPKEAIDPLVAVVKEKGKNGVCSSENFYLHLQRLQTMIPKSVGNSVHIEEFFSHRVHQDEAGARAWIDAIFFRVSALTPANKSMVLIEELTVPPTAVSSQDGGMIRGYVDFIAVAADKTTAGGSSLRPALLFLI